MTQDIEAKESGLLEVTLRATGSNGLPDIAWLRIFPLDGQKAPEQTDLTGVSRPSDDRDGLVDVYTLSGVWIKRVPESQLGISLGNQSSAVVVLPNCVGETPNIVRKQRLK